jgi:isopentenyl phosphate kinase
MQSKVALMLDLVQHNPGLTVRIFSAEAPGSLYQALEGANLGTLIRK